MNHVIDPNWKINEIMALQYRTMRAQEDALLEDMDRKLRYALGILPEDETEELDQMIE